MGSGEGRRDITVDAVFDIETEDWTTFVLGGFLTADGIYKQCDWRKEREFAEFIWTYEGTVWAHNGGRFDFLWLLDWAIKLKIENRLEKKIVITPSGSGIVGIRLGKLKLFDSYALVKISLDAFSKATDAHKSETGLKCRCGTYCGGYCAISRNMPVGQWNSLCGYQRRDCEALLFSLQKLQSFANGSDIDLGATVGGSAWRNAKRSCNLPDASLAVADHMFTREAYFGGRVQLLKPFSKEGFEYDVSSMYPSRLASCELPWGDSSRVWGREAREAYQSNKAGIYRAEVSVPLTHLCPLPVRTKDRVIYPYGTFTGNWALPELSFAESLGVKVIIREALVWETQRVIFKDWIERLFAIRTNAPGGKSGPLGTFIKYYMNSLTGKFGSKPVSERIIINPTDGPKPCTCLLPCDGECGCYRPLDDAGFIVAQKTFRIGPEAHVEWAAYLTAEARVEWLRQALSAGDNGLSMVYGDTDSLFSEKELTRNIAKGELGKWECSGAYKKFVGYAPKVYHFERADIIKVRAKGVALPYLKDASDDVKQTRLREAVVKLENGEALSRQAVQGFRRGATNGKFFEKVTNSRHVSRGFGDRILRPGSDTTEPQEYNQDEDEEE